MQEYNFSLLGLDISFRAGVGEDRIDSARQLVEERFETLKARGERSSKELLLTFLVLGLADDLLQSNKQMVDVHERVSDLLTKIEDLTIIE